MVVNSDSLDSLQDTLEGLDNARFRIPRGNAIKPPRELKRPLENTQVRFDDSDQTVIIDHNRAINISTSDVMAVDDNQKNSHQRNRKRKNFIDVESEDENGTGKSIVKSNIESEVENGLSIRTRNHQQRIQEIDLSSSNKNTPNSRLNGARHLPSFA